MSSRLWSFAVVTAIGFLLTGALFWEFRHSDLQRFRSEFEKEANIRALFIQNKLENCLMVTEALVRLFSASDLVEPDEFRTFAQPLLARTAEISAIAWVPMVPRERLGEYEEFARRYLRPDFAVSMRGSEAGSAPADRPGAYYPLMYVEPGDCRYAAQTGLDLGSVPGFPAALEKAGRSGELAVFGMSCLIDDGVPALAVVAPWRVSIPEDAGSGSTQWFRRGFIIAVVQQGRLLSSLLESIGTERFDFRLLDVSDPGAAVPILGHACGPPAAGTWVLHLPHHFPLFSREISFADRAWRLEIRPGHGYLAQNLSPASWVVLIAGIMLSLLMGLYISSVYSQRNQLGRLVDERTAELRSSEEKYRLLAQNAHDVIWVLDLNLRFTYVSPSAVKLSWYEESESLDLGLEDILTPESYRRVIEILGKVMSRDPDRQTDPGESHTLELELRRKDGSSVWTEVTASALFNQEGVVIGIMGISRDISERKAAEEALRESEEKYRQLVENASEAIFVSQDGNFRFVNSKIEEVLGLPREELINTRFDRFIHPDDRPMIEERYEGRLKGQDVSPVYVFRIMDRDGRIRWAEVNAIVIHWQGRPAMLHFLTDVTERVLADEQKKVLERRLAQAQKMEAIGTLAGGIAHDFNNILSSVLGYSGLARMKLESGQPLGDELDQIMKAGVRARDLVKQILTFSRQAEIRKENVTVAPIVKETVKLLRASLPTTIEIRQDLGAASSTVMADPTQIHQIIMNLFTNAAYAMRERGGVLDVRLEELDAASIPDARELEVDTCLRLSVSDTGEGIPPAIIDKVFDPFFTTKRRGEGTGMGLAVVHGIVREMGGAISVNSREGVGTTFHILLPVSRAAGSPEVIGRERVIGGGGRILFVDDEEGIVDSGQRILEQLGYRVVPANSPARALEIFRQQPGEFDLVLTDMLMPGMTGIELSSIIHQTRLEIPVVLCTGFGHEITEEKIRDAGIASVVMKPLVPGELAEVVHRTLGLTSHEDGNGKGTDH